MNHQMDDICAITHRHKSKLDVPVLNIRDGRWYEYAPIMLWLESNSTSPVTRGYCEPCDLVAPNDIWLVIDKSGSMSSKATNVHVKEQTDICIMDLVAYSCIALLKSISACRKNQFTFGAIFYDSGVTYIFERQLLTNTSIRSFEEEMRSHARPYGMTNWSAPLEEVLSRVTSQNTDIIFLTDGLPNVANDSVLTVVSGKMKSTNISLHAVAIGYGGIDCGLLSEVAEMVKRCQSEQQYARCPGGLYFIASVTDVMDTILTLATSIAVQPSEDRKQRRLSNHSDLQRSKLIDLLRSVLEITRPHVSRFSATMDTTLTQLHAAQQLVQQYQEKHADPLFEPDVAAALAGTKAFSTWGNPFIHSLLDSHESMQVRNKYDSMCQVYAALHEDWDSVYEQVMTVFKTLPMPTSILAEAPPRRPPGHCNTSPSPPVTMAHAYMTCSGCIGADTMVMVPGEEQWVKASSLRYGMEVVVSAACVPNIDKSKKPYRTAKIELIMETKNSRGCHMIVIDESVAITPYHPVQLVFGGEWMFPARLNAEHGVSLETSSAETVYSFVLDEEGARAPNIITKGATRWILAATLTHGLQGPVIGHSYFGTNRVVEDLYKLGPENGKVALEPAHFRRNEHREICQITKDI